MSSTLTTTVSNGYIELPVTTDPTVLQQNALAAIASELPGWVPREGHIEVLLLEQFAAMIAESSQVAAQVPEAIFSYFGSLLGVVPIQGAYATAPSTWTMIDNQGYTVPSGTIVGYQVLGNQTYQFVTTQAFTVAAGSTTTAPGSVILQAQTAGTAFNGLAAQTLTLIQPSLTFVTSVVTTLPSSGGADQETTTAYLNRLSAELQLLTPRPILAADYAALAPNVPGVYRATAFNGLNPFANIALTSDASFGTSNAWTATQNGTKSTGTGSYAESTLKMTAGSAGTNMILTGESYYISQNQSWLSMVTLDQASAAVNVTLSVAVYDINGTLLTTFTGTPVLDSTTKLTYLWLDFLAPANAYTCKTAVTWTTPATGATHQLVNFSLSNVPAPTNFVPDSSFLQVPGPGYTWIGAGSPGASPPATFSILPVLSGQNCLSYTGTGGASGTIVAHSLRTLLPAGTYTASALIDGTWAAVGGAQITITNDSGATLATATQTTGVKSTVSASFTLGSATVVQFNYSTNNCTVGITEAMTMTAPQITAGTVVPAYTPGITWTPANLINSNERMVTVAAVDVNGNTLSTVTEAALAAYLQSMREVNFIVNVIGPSYNGIDVQWSGVASVGANPSTVLAAANAALNSYLSPANWAGGTATPPYWDPTQNIVRYLSIVTLLGEIPGMDHLTSVIIGPHGQTSLEPLDVDMTGTAPLPVVGTITGNVTTH